MKLSVAILSLGIASGLAVSSAHAAAPIGSFGGSFGGVGGVAPPPEPDPETTPNRPLLYIIWKTNNSAKIRFTDQSEVETGVRIERRAGQGAWVLVDDVPAQAGAYLSQEIVVPNLQPETNYCFRAIAYRQYGGELLESTYRSRCTTTPATSCPGSDIDELLELAHSGAREKRVTCDLHLEPGNVITKRLIVQGPTSNITIDLNGARLNGGLGTFNHGRDMIEVRSREVNPTNDPNQISSYQRPANITIKNGEIIGSVRIWGMAKNGEGDPTWEDVVVCGTTCITVRQEVPGSNQYRKSSYLAGHTGRAQANAPTNIVLDNVTITGVSRIPVYFSPGVTNSKLINSEVKGASSNTGIYLDAESSGNLIKGNYLHVRTGGNVTNMWDRPQINIDGSAHNRIINNLFAELSHGGIYLYRNCGEAGVVRHQTPSYNQIINNRFIYVNYGPSSVTGSVNPSVYIGARDRGVLAGWFTFCGDDNSHPYGSGVSDRDHATHNVVMQNQIYRNSVNDMIVTQNPSLNSPNFIDYNTTVTPETVDNWRAAGCYIPNEQVDFILHGQTYDATNSNGAGTRYSCNDGNLSSQPIVTYFGTALLWF